MPHLQFINNFVSKQFTNFCSKGSSTIEGLRYTIAHNSFSTQQTLAQSGSSTTAFAPRLSRPDRQIAAIPPAAKFAASRLRALLHAGVWQGGHLRRMKESQNNINLPAARVSINRCPQFALRFRARFRSSTELVQLARTSGIA